MKLGNIRIYIFILIIFLGNMINAIAVDKIESVPLINLEELVPTFEEDKDVMEDKYEQNDSLQKLEINLLNVQLGNYKTLHVQDSLHIAFMNEKTDLLNQRIELYIDLTKELRPKWYNKPAIHFVLGVATIVTASWVVSNVK